MVFPQYIMANVVQPAFLTIWIFLVLFLSENSGLQITRVANLGTVNNVTSTKINITLFNFGFQAIADVNAYAAPCDKYVILKTDRIGMKIRPIPKGNCHKCCQVQTKDIQIELYTKDQPNKPILLPHMKKGRSRYNNLNRNTKVIVYIHGFLEITELGSSQILKDAYLHRSENYAIIIIDWSELVSFPWYIDATLNARQVGIMLAKFLESYSDAGHISMKNLHVIGFSLGAHAAGIAGKYLRADLRIPRITGLDPAYPGFQDVGEAYRLCYKDAEFVDIIHTDGGNYGFYQPLGHVDFYPNDGTHYQPGCDYRFLKQTNQIYDILSCSHNRAYRLYAESVYSPYNFAAVKCAMPKYGRNYVCNHSDIAYMGFATNKNYSGTYFLKTNKDTPYGRSGFDIRQS